MLSPAVFTVIVISTPVAGVAGVAGLFWRLFATRKGGVRDLEDETYSIEPRTMRPVARASVLPARRPR